MYLDQAECQSNVIRYPAGRELRCGGPTLHTVARLSPFPKGSDNLRDALGNLLMEAILETKAEMILPFAVQAVALCYWSAGMLSETLAGERFWAGCAPVESALPVIKAAAPGHGGHFGFALSAAEA